MIHSRLIAKAICSMRSRLILGRGRRLRPRNRFYRAGLFLFVGQVEKAERLLREVNRERAGPRSALHLDRGGYPADKDQRQAAAHSERLDRRILLPAVENRSPGALEAAKQAAAVDPAFGFAWTRVADLQFSFGRVPQAKEALEKVCSLAPRNPAAHALRGFLFSAENNINDAKDVF